jgi:hypothetical protein
MIEVNGRVEIKMGGEGEKEMEGGGIFSAQVYTVQQDNLESHILLTYPILCLLICP